MYNNFSNFSAGDSFSFLVVLVLQLLATDTFDQLGASGRWIRLACYLADYFIIGYDASFNWTYASKAIRRTP